MGWFQGNEWAKFHEGRDTRGEPVNPCTMHP